MQGISLGSWILDLENLTFDETENRLKVLGIEKNKMLLPDTLDFFLQRIYVEDLPRVQDLILNLIQGEIDAFEVTYRIRTVLGGLRWFHDSCHLIKEKGEANSKRAIGETIDITESKVIEDRLTIEHEHALQNTDEFELRDPLTHLLSKSETIMQLKALIELKRGDIEFLSVALICIKNFFELNDQEGRMITDHVLVRASDIIGKSLNEGDLLGRYSVDCFLVAYKKVPNTMAEAICKNVVDQIESYDYGNDIPVKISYNLAEYLGESANELISKLVCAL
ncbi:diguanylate cyclase [Fusibacter bizertensis]|uniref:Diguanylate cyclase n=1 Tax=Fusibacter bizertensis TaxID=1488331 RepID=A0ABT6NC80_9FIRM|nr:diguanylate cyclase [Fusibacter bizertensis]MDH8678033.1 diguanylate cyclase [Fusibacter bizertensis]